MRFKISHALVDVLEDRDNLHASIPKIRALLAHLIGDKGLNERNIRINLLVHECLSMVGIKRKHEVEGTLDLKNELQNIFFNKEVIDPFVFTRYPINENSIEFQDKILAREVLELPGNSSIFIS